MNPFWETTRGQRLSLWKMSFPLPPYLPLEQRHFLSHALHRHPTSTKRRMAQRELNVVWYHGDTREVSIIDLLNTSKKQRKRYMGKVQFGLVVPADALDTSRRSRYLLDCGGFPSLSTVTMLVNEVLPALNG